jgi:hypothetical protein
MGEALPREDADTASQEARCVMVVGLSIVRSLIVHSAVKLANTIG